MLPVDLPETGVYIIRNTQRPNRLYIGSTGRNFSKRWREHEKALNGNGHHSAALQRGWLKYGPSSFSFEVVFRCASLECLLYEQVFFDALKPKYNVCPIAGSNRGLHWNLSAESKKRISEYQRNRSPQHMERLVLAAQNQPPEKLAKLAAYAFNRTQSHLQKLAEASASLDVRQKRSRALRGQKRSEETRARMSIAQLETQNRPEVKAKIAATINAIDPARRAATYAPIAAAAKQRLRARSVINEDDVRAMRALSAAGSSTVDLGIRYGMHRRTVSDIIRRKTWGDVE